MRISVYLVERGELMRRAARQMLEALGCHVEIVAGMDAAVASGKALSHELTFLDLDMPILRIVAMIHSLHAHAASSEAMAVIAAGRSSLPEDPPIEQLSELRVRAGSHARQKLIPLNVPFLIEEF